MPPAPGDTVHISSNRLGTVQDSTIVSGANWWSIHVYIHRQDTAHYFLPIE